jgi:hypothetical protein
MDAPKEAIALWDIEYYLTVISPHGTIGGEGWYPANAVANATVNPLTVFVGLDEYNFTNWSGDASGTSSPSNPILMDAAKTAIANWEFIPPPPTSVVLASPSFELVLTVQMLDGTIRRYPVDVDGRLLVDVFQTSPDGQVTLQIPAGTLVLNPGGTPAYLNDDPDVWAVLATSPPATADTAVVVYQFLPVGLEFSQDVTIIAEYSPGRVPSGSVAYVASYNEASGQWIELETAGYVVGGQTVPNTVSTRVDNFDNVVFAVLARTE